ncbi:MAG: NosD domain-containing protein [Candidatus Bathyarchaeia archaeon]
MFGVKRFALSPLSVFILCSLVIAVLNIDVVEEDDIVTIRADGTVYPSNVPIQRVGNVYTLTSDVNAIRVQKNDIILDGNGHRVSGAGATPVILACIPSITGVRNVTIKNLIITGGDMGIVLDRCSNVTISGNVITGTKVAVPQLQATGGIFIWAGNSNIISGNRIENNIVGIRLGYGTKGNIIFRNNITNNKYGIQLWEASNNTFHHNLFINNTVQVYDASVVSPHYVSPSVNTWDNGVECNYWSDYNGTDNNRDGIGDTPYIIDENNQDNYPLMKTGIPPFQQSESFPTTWVVAAIVVAGVVGAALLFFYFEKVKKKAGKSNIKIPNRAAG